MPACGPKSIQQTNFGFLIMTGTRLGPDEVRSLMQKMTGICLIESHEGNFTSLSGSAAINAGGRLPVVDATQSDQEVDSGGAMATVDGTGLRSELFPTFHSGANKHGWLGRDDQNKGFRDPDRYGWLHYDLGSQQQLCGLRIWNYNDVGALNARSVRDIDVFVSNDKEAFGDNRHKSWRKVTELVDIPRGPGYKSKQPYGADFEVSDAPRARYVRLDVQRNWGNGWNTALAEVQFFGSAEKQVVAVTEIKLE